jgi:hypothetical protein
MEKVTETIGFVTNGDLSVHHVGLSLQGSTENLDLIGLNVLIHYQKPEYSLPPNGSD